MTKNEEKKSALRALSAGIGKFSPPRLNQNLVTKGLKKADSYLANVEMPKADKPTAAGEEVSDLDTKPKEKVLSSEDKSQNSPLISQNMEMKKLSVVLSQAVRKAMSTGGQYTPYNVGVSTRPQPPAPVMPPPVGAAPQQPQQPQQPQNPAAYQGALGGPGAISPSANPINNYGPISRSGDINGNAAFGVKNSPGSSKSAASVCSILDNKKSIEEGKKVEDVKPKFQKTENKADLNPNDATNKKQEEKAAGVPKSIGGQRWQFGEAGINPQLGYKYMLGVIPTPDVALRVGTPSAGVGIGMHPWPYIFSDKGQPSGRMGNRPRSLYKYLGDNMRSPEDAFFVELGNIEDNAPAGRYEKLLRDRGVGRSSEEIRLLSKILSESADVRRNSMARRLPAAVQSVLKNYNPNNPKSLFMNKQSNIALAIYAKAAARGDQAMKQEKEYNRVSRSSNFAAMTRGVAKEHKPEDFEYIGGGRLGRGSPLKKDQNRVRDYAQHIKKLRASNQQD